MTCKIAFGTLGNALSTLNTYQQEVLEKTRRPMEQEGITQAMRTFFGRLVFGSFTFTKANWILPSENSSIKSISSPSDTGVSRRVGVGQREANKATSSPKNLQNTLFAGILLESAHEGSLNRVHNPLAVSRRLRGGTRGRRSVNDGLVVASNGGTVGRRIQRSHTAEG